MLKTAARMAERYRFRGRRNRLTDYVAERFSARPEFVLDQCRTFPRTPLCGQDGGHAEKSRSSFFVDIGRFLVPADIVR